MFDPLPGSEYGNGCGGSQKKKNRNAFRVFNLSGPPTPTMLGAVQFHGF